MTTTAQFTAVNGAKVFPVGAMRYSVTTQSDGVVDDHGCFDSFEAAIAFASSTIPSQADSFRVWDHVRGYVVAKSPSRPSKACEFEQSECDECTAGRPQNCHRM